jgi:hypothetical protein
MRLPIGWGLALLAGLWVLHALLDDPRLKTALLIVAMAVALWTAFSLNIPARKAEPEDPSVLEPPEEESGEGPANDESEAAEPGGVNKKPG